MTGRNDLCPCGSGKKYKQCCLKKDEEARRAAQAEAERAAREATVAPLLPLTPPAEHLPAEAEADDMLSDEPEPEDEADFQADLAIFNARWEEFEAAEDCEGQIAIFQATMDDGLLDADFAFEMMDVIYESTVVSGERDRFDALVALLRQRLPDVYAHNAHYYADWLISNALAAGRLDALPALADELADTAGEQIDIVTRVFDQLAYHGQLAVLAAAMRRAWPLVRDAGSIFEWAISEFAERTMTVAMLDYLERTADPDAAELEALGADFDVTLVRPGGAAQFVAHITGQAGRRWTLDDFDLAEHRRRKGEAKPPAANGRTNFYDLTVEFQGYLRREEGVSYAKGELARDQIQHYILERYAGKLSGDDDWRETRKTGRKARASAPVHLLCPDRNTLDRYLVGLLRFLSSKPYRAAALFEMLPAWLRFLEARELIDAGQRDRTLHELSSLVRDLIKVWDSYRLDPALRLAAEGWRENAGLRSES